MTDWFRSWHGAPTDSKWLVIGRKAGVPPGIVSAIVWALFDHASQQEGRGDVSTFDVETYSTFSGFEEAQISAVIKALQEKEIIENGRLKTWEKRQPKREDNAAERARTWRENHRTQPNATEREGWEANARERNRTQPSTTERPEESREDTEESRKKEKEESSLRSDARANGLELSGEQPAAKKPRRVPSTLADDFALTEALREFANVRGYPGQICDRLFERFCEHAKSKGLKYTDWAAAWRTWVLNQVEFDSRRPGSTGPPHPRPPDV